MSPLLNDNMDFTRYYPGDSKPQFDNIIIPQLASDLMEQIEKIGVQGKPVDVKLNEELEEFSFTLL